MLEDDFCDIIKKARMGLGWSVSDLARTSGLFATAITRLERGGATPTREEARALGSALGLRAAPLEKIANNAWAPAPMPPTVRCVRLVMGSIGGYAVKGYLLHDEGEAVFVDTAYNASAMLDLVERQGLRLKAVCLTHGHSDHADGLDRILARWDVPVYLGAEDEKLLSWQPAKGTIAPNDGAQLTVGKLTVTCMTTPGHTPGGMCYQVDGAGRPICFVGDTLFAGSIGRANPFSLYPVHLHSVRRRVLMLPSDTILLPGHGPATTVAEEREQNPFASQGTSTDGGTA
jgi:glyoxylase-like metal-dependent hydrolase (beta-lactamase superfamily II)